MNEVPDPVRTPAKTSGLAVGSLIGGLLGLPTLGLGAVAGIVLGHLSLSQIKSSSAGLGGRRLAITGLTLSYLALGLIIIAAVAGMVAPLVLRQKTAAQRTEVNMGLRNLGLSLMEFEQEFGSLPDDETAPLVVAATGSLLPMTGSQVFNQLVAFGSADVDKCLEVPHGAQGSWIYFPNGDPSGDGSLLVSPKIAGKSLRLKFDQSVDLHPGEPEAGRVGIEIPAVVASD